MACIVARVEGAAWSVLLGERVTWGNESSNTNVNTLIGHKILMLNIFF